MPKRTNPAELVIFGNPRKAGKKQNRTGVGPGSWVHTPGRSEVYRVVEMQGGPRGRNYLLEGPYPSKARVWTRGGNVYLAASPNPGRRANQDSTGELEQAVTLFRQFHGREPEEILTEQRSAAMRLEYVALGELLGLAPLVPDVKIPSPAHWDDGGYPVLLLEKAAIKLAANAAGTQLYAIGGDQNISEVLGDFPDVDATKDLLDLGELAYVVYKARKSMDGFDEKEYMHTFDEPRPSLGYDQVKQELFFIGGRYTVDAPGIDH